MEDNKKRKISKVNTEQLYVICIDKSDNLFGRIGKVTKVVLATPLAIGYVYKTKIAYVVSMLDDKSRVYVNIDTKRYAISRKSEIEKIQVDLNSTKNV